MNTPRYPIMPRLSAPTSVQAMMSDVIVALLPALGMSIYLFGWRVLLLATLSVGTCVLFQGLYGIFSEGNWRSLDFSPCVTGLLLAFCYPVNLPLWAVPLGSFFAIIVVKELYGGLGCNFLNPALAGRMFLASSPLLMTKFQLPNPLLVTPDGVDVISSATPLDYLSRGRLPIFSTEELLLGIHSGSIGEGSVLMLGLGGIYLLLRQVITPLIPLSFLGTVATLTYVFPPEGIAGVDWMLAHICSGGLVLGAFFMATDPVTSPVSPQSQVTFGIGCGFLTLILRIYGSYPEGVGFAILTMNGLVWLLDYLGTPRRFAQKHFTVTRYALKRLWMQIKAVRMEKPKLPKFSALSIKKTFTSEGTGMPGEQIVPRLPKTLRCIFAYGFVLILAVGSISWAYTLTLLQTYRTEEAMKQVLLAEAMPRADFISETPFQSPLFTKLYGAYQGQEQIGYCVEVSASGFTDTISLLVGVSFNGAVTGIAVVNHGETLKIGAEVLTQESLSRYVGRSGTLSLFGSNAVDVVTGATVTQSAITDCVNRALEVVQNIDDIDQLHLYHGSV